MSESKPPVVTRAVPSGDSGSRLDVFLAGWPEVSSRAYAKRLIRAGAVEVDGQRGKPGQNLAEGATVSCSLIPDTVSEPVGQDPNSWGFELPVLFEDAFILVVDKPVGLSAHRADSGRRMIPNVADLASLHCDLAPAAGDERRGIVHRLDKETSGVMVLAKTDEAFFALKAQFRARSTAKEYRAIVWGEPRFDSDWIDRPIAVHPRQGDRMVVVQEGGKPAQTFYRVLERFGSTSYVQCEPKTGRTHQIRVHMASIGHSLVSDRIYRSRNQQQATLPGDAPDPGRQCLHARALSFDHPKTGERMTVDAPLPEDLETLLAWCR